MNKVTFNVIQSYLCILCLPYVCSNVYKFREKHNKTQHCDLLLLVIGKLILNVLENVGQENI
jgi:hypothetical protein